MQHRLMSLFSKEPYESSKWASNLIALKMSERFKQNHNPIISIITSPGVVASNIGGLPPWIGRVRRMVHYAVSCLEQFPMFIHFRLSTDFFHTPIVSIWRLVFTKHHFIQWLYIECLLCTTASRITRPKLLLQLLH